MIKNLSHDNLKNLIENFISLSLLQVLTYLLPLITIPYLIRILGLDNFGKMVFIQSFISYFNICISYGFNLTATNQIAQATGNHSKLNELFSSVLATKFLLFIVSFGLILIAIFSIKSFYADKYAYLAASVVLISNVITPEWLFHGLQKMKYLTYSNVIGKTIATIAIFIFIKHESELDLAILITSSGFLFTGLITLAYSFFKFKIQITTIKIDTIRTSFKSGFNVFLSQVLVFFYTTVNILLLGFFGTNLMVGKFSVAHKIFGAVSGLSSMPFNRAIFPLLSESYIKSKEKYSELLKYFPKLMFYAFSAISLITIVLSDYLVLLVSGEFNNEVSWILRILALAVVFAPFGGYFTQALIIQKQERDLLKVVAKTAVFNLVIAIIAINLYGALGLAIATNFTLLFVIYKVYQKMF